MAKITKDLAEQLYERYVATLMNPVSFEDMFTADGNLFEVNDAIRWTYDNGVVVPAEQLNRLHYVHKQAADPAEPYDVGFFNGLEMAMFVCDLGERVPMFMDKPEVVDLQPEIDRLNVLIVGERVDLQIAKEELATAKKDHAAEIKNRDQEEAVEISKLKAALEAEKEVVVEEVEEAVVEKPAPKKGLLSKLTGKK